MPLPSDDALRGSPIPGITRNVFLLGLVSLATDASTEMLYPLIPLFLAQTLRAPAPFWMGATLAAGAALLVALTPDPRPARAPAR